MSAASPVTPLRNLVVVLGDQLDRQSSAFDGFDPALDRVWMAEVADEALHAWSSKPRIALFLAAMRHFADELRARGWPLTYQHLDDADAANGLDTALSRAIAAHRPERLLMCAPGDWRVLQLVKKTAQIAGLPLEIRDDRHFFSNVRDFAEHARDRRQLRLEYFYRELRRRRAVLMDGDAPVGGRWNFDHDNRQAFPSQGPATPLPSGPDYRPDARTQQVLQLVEQRFSDHPGQLDRFAWAVTREQALDALHRFIAERLPLFGRYQDAMWQGEPWLYHSQLAAALNLKLLSAREVVAAAEAAWRSGHAELAAVEGFIRQILGWREYVRGLYWTQMPSYLERNALDARLPLPAFYWNGKTEMRCLRDAIEQTLSTGYAHHIQRLMVTGLYALLLGVDPKQLHGWYLSVYVDAVEWVELPNTLGMSQYADGGLMASKPYVASGKYIQRMSNSCAGCRFDPAQASGLRACPFTTLYWDFLARHRDRLASNPRMAMQLKNLARLDGPTLDGIRAQAAQQRSAATPAPTSSLQGIHSP